MALSQSPFIKALKEAQSVVVVSVVLGVSFNLFASTGLPWERAKPPELEEASDSLLYGGAGNADILPSDTLVTDIDSLLVDDVDTGLTAKELEQMRLDSLRAYRDSVTKAKKDSISKAQEEIAAIDDEPLPDTQGNIASVNTAKAKEIFDKKIAQFIDARRSDQFSEGHIPGAISVYGYDFESGIPKLLPLDKDKLVVVYCDGGDCDLSHKLAELLVDPNQGLGFKRVVVYTGGYEEWTEKNYPTKTGGE